MNVPFTAEEFMGIMRTYNLAVWPAQIAAYLLGGAALLLTFRRTRYSDRLVTYILAGMWLMNGVGYHLGFFTRINPAAYGFGVLFIIEGAWLIFEGVWRDNLVFGRGVDGYSVTGWAMVFYAMILYPLLGVLSGHLYPFSPMFGLAPCPTTIFTFGLLLTGRDGFPLRLAALPFIWSIIGSFAALKWGVYEDTGLLVAGLAGGILLVSRKRRDRGEVTEKSVVAEGL